MTTVEPFRLKLSHSTFQSLFISTISHSLPFLWFVFSPQQRLKIHMHKQTFHVRHCSLSLAACVMNLSSLCVKLSYCLPHSSELCRFFLCFFFLFLHVGFIFYFHLKMNLRNILRSHGEMWWEDEQLRALKTVLNQYEEYLFLLLYVCCLGRVCGLWK